MLAEILFQSDDAIHIDSVQIEAHLISLAIHSSQSVCCPDCGQSCTRVHSHYVRKFADVPWVGIAVRFFFSVRRLFCDNPACQRHTFTEQVPSLVAPFAQRTGRLAAIQRMLGFALGGEAGARATQDLGMATSPDTLLRLIRSAPEVQWLTPRVLGVDDWALRKGQNYATLLIDGERSCPVYLLPDRNGATLKQWLLEHPGVEIITRDRASAYAEAARRSARRFAGG